MAEDPDSGIAPETDPPEVINMELLAQNIYLTSQLQQQRERVEKLEQVYLIAWSIVHSHHSTAAVQGDEMDSCTNDHCREIQTALKELEAPDEKAAG